MNNVEPSWLGQALKGNTEAFTQLVEAYQSPVYNLCYRMLGDAYEAEDAAVIYPSVAWTEVADAVRGDGAYMRCFPAEDANGIAQGLRFTILNPQDCKGRFAVFGVGYDDADVPGVWTHQVTLRSGNLSQEGASDYYAESTQSWQLIFAGEFELPLTDVADVTSGYDAGPYLEWWATRASGGSDKPGKPLRAPSVAACQRAADRGRAVPRRLLGRPPRSRPPHRGRSSRGSRTDRFFPRGRSAGRSAAPRAASRTPTARAPPCSQATGAAAPPPTPPRA